MELKRDEQQILMIYALTNSMMNKEERKEAREAINEDLNRLLEEKQLNHDEYNEMHKELDKIDEMLE
nr:MAG TPA: hypothetical protein [Caudoviricetes sp.]